MQNSFSTVREAWIDNTKMFAMICVIAGHVGGLFGGWPYSISGFIAAFNMPIFMLLTGYTSYRGVFNIDSFLAIASYFERLLWRMVIPAVSLSAIDQAWIGSIFARKLWLIFAAGILLLWLIEKGPFIYSVSGNQHLSAIKHVIKIALTASLLISSVWLNMYWFLASLMIFQVSSALLLWSVRNILPPNTLVWLLFFSIWIGSFFLLDHWSFEMSFYFGLGLICKQFDLFKYARKIKPIVALLLFLVGFILCKSFTLQYGFYFSSPQSLIQNSLFYIYPLRTAVAVMLCFSIIYLFITVSKNYSWFSYMGQFTLAFYTIHSLMTEDFIKPYICNSGQITFPWIVAILTTICVTAFTYLIIYIFKQWSLTRVLVLGIK